MSELNENHLRPPGILEEPVAECAVCTAELYDGQDVYAVYCSGASEFVCSTTCALAYHGASMVMLGDDAN